MNCFSAPSLRAAGGVGDQLGEDRDAAAVLAGVGRLLVDRLHDQLDQALEQRAELAGEAMLRERDGGLRRERLGQREALGRKAAAGAQQLEHADHVALVVPHRDRQVSALGLVQRAAGQRGVFGEALEAARALLLVARVPLQQQVAHELVLRVAQREGAGARVGDAHRAAQDRREQALGVLLHRERAAHGADGLDHGDVVLDVGRHRVEGVGQLLEFVAGREPDARAEVARGETPRGDLELLDRHQAAPHQHERGEAHCEQRQQRDEREHGAEARERREQRRLRLGQLDRPCGAAELRAQEQLPDARALLFVGSGAGRGEDRHALRADREVDARADGLRQEQEARLDLGDEQLVAGDPAEQRDVRAAVGADAQQRAARGEVPLVGRVERHPLAPFDAAEALVEERRQARRRSRAARRRRGWPRGSAAARAPPCRAASRPARGARSRPARAAASPAGRRAARSSGSAPAR